MSSQRKRRSTAAILGWIIAQLLIAAIAALFGLNRISGIALTGANLLIVVALVMLVLIALGVFAIA
ncbi:DUF1328 family protein [Jannaschia aquimarina]|uniref:Uncharacterized protein n=1 Tax=Jannaschia aquimarina TaxID=935700 RepID=A0A0D1EFB0_9RHOB|nr:DUF1328 family protein [Jannaschia aquimarina]KIT14595.1 hypothetical protein jaqu_36730 [Jannaschia aquimarina]SNS77066.1 Protein of unknown function [Jannaschia aquimarina]